MKCYKMTPKDMTRGVCWQYALACMLEIKPSKIPNFVTPKSDIDIEDRTRAWLQKKHKKSIVYLPVNLFFESEDIGRYNSRGGPDGFSIMLIRTNDETVNHVVIAKDGKYHFNPCDNAFTDFQHTLGFYVIYDTY